MLTGMAVLGMGARPAASAPAGPTVAAAASTAGTFDGSDQAAINLPSGSGGLLLAVAVADGGVEADIRFLGTGWVTIGSSLNAAVRMTVAYKFATGTDTVTLTDQDGFAAGQGFNARVLRISGAHASTAPAIGTYANGTSTAPNSGSLDPAGWATENTMWIAACGMTGLNTITGFPTGYDDNQFQSSSNSVSMGLATKVAAAASDDPGAFTITSMLWRAVTVAVRPAA